MDWKQSIPELAGRDDNYRIPGTVQISVPVTLAQIQSRTGRFREGARIESPTVRELVAFMQAEMAKLPKNHVPGEPPGPDRLCFGIIFPNNLHPLGTCAGCGAEEAKKGGPLQVCAKCKERKYCGRKCQRVDWSKHKYSTCVEILRD